MDFEADSGSDVDMSWVELAAGAAEDLPGSDKQVDSPVDFSWVELVEGDTETTSDVVLQVNCPIDSMPAELVTSEVAARLIKRDADPCVEIEDKEAKSRRVECVVDTDDLGDAMPFEAEPPSVAAPLTYEPGSLLREVKRVLGVMMSDDNRLESQDAVMILDEGAGGAVLAHAEHGTPNAAEDTTFETIDIDDTLQDVDDSSLKTPESDAEDMAQKGIGDIARSAEHGMEGADVDAAPVKKDDTNSCDCYDCRTNPMTRLMGSGRCSGITDHAGRLLLRKQDQRPFAEPPPVNYDRFAKEHVPSDKMIREMFPNDPVGRTAYRDAQTENELLKMFSGWNIEVQETEAEGQFQCIAKDCATCHFHDDLRAELQIDLDVVGEEFNIIQTSLSDLQVWQKTYLDMDGELDSARRQLDVGRNIFGGRGGSEALAKYGQRLAPIPKDELAVWEGCHLGINGTISKLSPNETLNSHKYLLDQKYYGGVAAKDKYLSAFEAFGDTKLSEIERRLCEKGEDIFLGLDSSLANAAKELLSHFLERLPICVEHNLSTWEHYHLGVNGTIARLWQEEAEIPQDLLESRYFGGLAAKAKYSALFNILDTWGMEWLHRLRHRGPDLAYDLEDGVASAASSLFSGIYDQWGYLVHVKELRKKHGSLTSREQLLDAGVAFMTSRATSLRSKNCGRSMAL